MFLYVLLFCIYSYHASVFRGFQNSKKAEIARNATILCCAQFMTKSSFYWSADITISMARPIKLILNSVCGLMLARIIGEIGQAESFIDNNLRIYFWPLCLKK